MARSDPPSKRNPVVAEFGCPPLASQVQRRKSLDLDAMLYKNCQPEVNTLGDTQPVEATEQGSNMVVLLDSVD